MNTTFSPVLTVYLNLKGRPRRPASRKLTELASEAGVPVVLAIRLGRIIKSHPRANTCVTPLPRTLLRHHVMAAQSCPAASAL